MAQIIQMNFDIFAINNIFSTSCNAFMAVKKRLFDETTTPPIPPYVACIQNKS